MSDITIFFEKHYNFLNYLSLLFAFFTTIIFIFLIIKFANKLSLIDIPNKRSMHKTIKPRGAGIAFYLSFLLTTLFFNQEFLEQNLFFFIATFLIFLIGIIDDIKGSSPKIKFIFIIIAITLLFFTTNLKITSLQKWFGIDISLAFPISLIFTIFAVTGYTNALNLLDGLDGLAGSIALIILLSFLYLGIRYHDNFIIYISTIFIINIIAFLIFNWYPSKIFMGDSGSLILGFIISILAIKLSSYISIASILFLAALPILDTILVMSRRIKNKKSPFIADKTHVHHILLKKHTKVDVTVMILILIQANFSMLGILLSHTKNEFLFALFLFFLFLFFKYFKIENDS